MRTMDEDIKKLSKIFYYFGPRNQTDKLVEEAVEVRDAVNDFNTAKEINDERCQALLHHALEEIVDCSIVLNQLYIHIAEAYKAYNMPLEQDTIDIKNNKIERTLKRINEGYYGTRFGSKESDVH